MYEDIAMSITDLDHECPHVVTKTVSAEGTLQGCQPRKGEKIAAAVKEGDGEIARGFTRNRVVQKSRRWLSTYPHVALRLDVLDHRIREAFIELGRVM